MDPITLAIGAVGLGMQIFGGMKSSEISHEQAQVSQDEALQESRISDLKQQQMEMEGNRQKLEQVRVAQRASALAQARATNQGAQFGSGLQGGLAQVTDQSLVNITGVNNALEIGRGINIYNKNISGDRMKLASLGADASTAQGISTLGGSLMKAGPMIGAATKGFGGGGGIGTFSDGGNNGMAPSWA